MNQGFVGWSSPHFASFPYVQVQDRKTAGTGGGTFTNGADRTRVLNTLVTDTAGIATLNTSNQIFLPGGMYYTIVRCPAYNVAENSAWLYDVTHSVELLRGANAYCVGNATAQYALIVGMFQLFAVTALEVRHRGGTTVATIGFGISINGVFTVPYETYTVAEFWRLQ